MKRPPLSGQLLIVALLILAFLVASIPVLISMTTRLQSRINTTKTTQKVDEAARAAFTQVSSILTDHPEVWDRLMRGETDSKLGFDGAHQFTGLYQMPYTVTCSRERSLLPDQLKVTITLLLPTQKVDKSRVYQAVFSHKTMGADLSEMAHVPAALYALGDLRLDLQGLEPPALDVHWGSIVCFGALTMRREVGGDNWGHHPRKFCKTGYFPPYKMTGRTDSQEYWVGFAMGNPVAIDETQYQQLAKSQMPTKERIAVGRGASGGFVNLPEQTIVFRSYQPPEDTQTLPVFYIDSSVRFESEGIDLGQGAMVITHNAIFDELRTGQVLDLHVPPHADREYPSLPSGAEFPCEKKMEAVCSSQEALGGEGTVDFRGFLYVKGDLIINHDTVMVGVVRVDGRLKIASGKKLTIFFDDVVSHAIFLKDRQIQQQIISQPL